MTDVHTPQVRTKNMRAIKSRDTAPELLFRKTLFRKGFRYRVDYKKLPGKPDIYLPKYKAAIFINGCFWHAHSCHLFKLPKSRQDFWWKKLSKNVERDEKNILALTTTKHRVLVVWECALKGKYRLLPDLVSLLAITWLKSEYALGYIDQDGLTCIRSKTETKYKNLTGVLQKLTLT